MLEYKALSNCGVYVVIDQRIDLLNWSPMSELYHREEEPQLICWDRSNFVDIEAQLEALKNSRTVYVGNLSFFTSEQQILETFSTVGPVKRLIMGVNSLTRTPCGFCFVEYYTTEHYHAALKYIHETACDDRVIRCDADAGYLPGRQFGRGKSGGQFRDERRRDYDPARGRLIPPEVMNIGNKRGRDRDFDDDNNDRQGKYGRGNSGRDRDYHNSRDNYRNDRRNDYHRNDYRRDQRNNHREVRTSTLDSGLHSSR